ncbi:sulfurtransferase [Aliiglaciecola litoralis]|uniref:sulfurtransferase n=1 Tax=Aliiglaciecola litoralis TaxID=582857 RepID=UPI0031D33B7D
MKSTKPKSLIEVDELNVMLASSATTVLYTRTQSNLAPPLQNEQSGYIPHSILFDFESDFVDKTSALPHMLPEKSQFIADLAKLGINQQSNVVVYDDQNMFCAPRVWWMLVALGFEKVSVLNGGLAAWLSDGKAQQGKLSTPQTCDIQQHCVSAYHRLASKKDVLNSITNEQCVIIDARGRSRFLGLEPEPRRGVRAGHIPTSYNLHYAALLESGRFKSTVALRHEFASLGLNLANKTLIFSCGSGVTACILALAAEQIGLKNWLVYDGSWSEWGADNNCPIA